jgi:hypothetical protein
VRAPGRCLWMAMASTTPGTNPSQAPIITAVGHGLAPAMENPLDHISNCFGGALLRNLPHHRRNSLEAKLQPRQSVPAQYEVGRLGSSSVLPFVRSPHGLEGGSVGHGGDFDVSTEASGEDDDWRAHTIGEGQRPMNLNSPVLKRSQPPPGQRGRVVLCVSSGCRSPLPGLRPLSLPGPSAGTSPSSTSGWTTGITASPRWPANSTCRPGGAASKSRARPLC